MGGSKLIEPPESDAGWSDSEITCSHCALVFNFSAQEKKFYSDHGLKHYPKRCKTCRQSGRQRRSHVSKAVNPVRRSGGPVTKLPSLAPSALYAGATRTKRALTTTLAFVESVRAVGSAGKSNYRVLATHGRGEEVSFFTETKMAMGDYVRLTRSTTEGLHRVYEHPAQPPLSECKGTQGPLLKGWMRSFNADDKTAVVKTRFSLLTMCLSDSEVRLIKPLASSGVSILFRPCLTKGELGSAGFVEAVAGYWPRPVPESQGPTCEVVEADSLLSLARDLGFNASYQVPANLSPLEYKDYELTSCLSVPESLLLSAEERVLERDFMARSGMSLSEISGDAQYQSLLATGLHPVITALSDVGKLIRYLSKSLEQVDDLGLERKVDVLYPVGRAITPGLLHTAVSTKLLNPFFFPYIDRIALLENPLPLLKMFARTGVPTGEVRLQHFAVITMHVRPRPRSQLPSVSMLSNATPECFKLKSAPLADDAAVRLLVPKGAASLGDLRASMPSGTLIHKVRHSMQTSYDAYVLTFGSTEHAKKFVVYVTKLNKSSTRQGQLWMAAPESGFQQNDAMSVFTLFGTSKLRKEVVYEDLEADWAYAINHNQIRFCSPLPLSAILDRVFAINSRSQRTRNSRPLLKIMNDLEQEIDLTRAYDRVPAFRCIYTKGDPLDTKWYQSTSMADPAKNDSDNKHGSSRGAAPVSRYWIEIMNVPLTASSAHIRGLVTSFAADAKDLSVGAKNGSLSIIFSTLDEKALHAVEREPVIARSSYLAYASLLGSAPSFSSSDLAQRAALSSADSNSQSQSESFSVERLCGLITQNPVAPGDTLPFETGASGLSPPGTAFSAETKIGDPESLPSDPLSGSEEDELSDTETEVGSDSEYKAPFPAGRVTADVDPVTAPNTIPDSKLPSSSIACEPCLAPQAVGSVATTVTMDEGADENEVPADTTSSAGPRSSRALPAASGDQNARFAKRLRVDLNGHN